MNGTPNRYWILSALSFSLMATAPTLASPVVSSITGTSSQVDAGCLGLLQVVGNPRCQYDDQPFPPGTFAGIGPSTGPITISGYYRVGSSPWDINGGPGDIGGIVGDGKYQVPLSGNVTIDDKGTACDADDTISAEIAYGAATRNFAGGPGTQGEETWGDGDLSFTLPETTVDSAAPNGIGGCDYVIGSAGAPPRLTTASGNEYGDDLNIGGADIWQPNDGSAYLGSAPTLSSLETFPNVGAPMTVTNGPSYSCTFFEGVAVDCLAFGSHHTVATSDGGTGERAAIENSIWVVSTDAAGGISFAEVYPVSEVPVGGFGQPQWISPRWEFTSDSGAGSVVESQVTGALGRTAQGCLQQLTVFVGDRENCMYNGGPPSFAGTQPDGDPTGPFQQVSYYDSETRPEAYAFDFLPSPNDGKTTPAVSGSITVDDNGNGFGSDDRISFDLSITAPDGGDIIRIQVGNFSEYAERFSRMTQVLAPTPVDSAEPNAFGGYDYVIGSAGFPSLIFYNDPDGSVCNGQPFGSSECFATFNVGAPDTLKWEPWTVNSGNPGIGSLEGNLGARTTGTVENLACIDNGISNNCFNSRTAFTPLVTGPNLTPGGGATAEDVGWDQLLLKVSTDADGSVVSAEGFDVQEYVVFGQSAPCGSDPGATQNCNSWVSGFFKLAGPTPLATDDLAETIVGTPVSIDVLANDTGFVDPVTVEILEEPVQGTVEVLGSPGPGADLRIEYTPAAGFAGPDSFRYAVSDGEASAEALVSVAVIEPSAAPDNATTNLNESVDIDVLVNDTGFSAASAIVVIGGPNSGTVEVIENPEGSGPPRLRYTPATGFSGADSLTYRVSDGVNEDTAEVSVEVLDFVATNDEFVVLRNGCCNQLDVLANDIGFEDPVTVSIISIPDQGGSVFFTNTFAGRQSDIRLQYTPNSSGRPDEYVETFNYRITDGENTDTALVSIRVVTFAAVDDFATTAGGQAVTVDVLANDLGFGFPRTLGVFTNPSNGFAEVQNAGAFNQTIRYTPSDGFLGEDVVEYFIDDGNRVAVGRLTIRVIADADGDLVGDSVDNCVLVPNPDQRDADGDGFGSLCDADLNNDGRVNFGDLARFRAAFGSNDPVADLDGSGIVNFADLARFRTLFGKPPGPSALAP